VPLLLVIGFVAGLIAGISPCILPVLPVVLVAPTAPAAPPPSGEAEDVAPPSVRRRRSVAIVAGLVVSFSAVTLLGSLVLSALGLPQDLLRDAGLVVLGLFGLGLAVPFVGHLIERPFARARGPRLSGRLPGFVLGLGLGAVFVPCAGPVLAAVSVVGATHHIGFTAVLLTLAFAVGAAVPLLAVALAGEELVARVRVLRNRGSAVRIAGGAVMMVMALVIGLNLTDGLQRDVPGYTSALQRSVEGTHFATTHLQALTGNGGGLASCTNDTGPLQQCGRAPAFTGITAWLHTSAGRPLNWSALRGKVVLVDFWTYSCINCQRTLPHVEAWYHRYKADGLVVVGVHTPEFAFEHVVSNVVDASRQLGVDYPVAVDDSYGTWDAYHNQYWPAEYLVDATGEVRHVHFAEGEYPQTESLIRSLLGSAHPGIVLPPATDVADLTPQSEINPETYLGYERLQYIVGANVVPDRPAAYTFPSDIAPGEFSLAGSWTVGAEKATAAPGARLELGFQADDIYLVLGGSGTVTVAVDGTTRQTIAVSGIPRLYTLLSGPKLQTGVLTLTFSGAVDAYDFTFG